MGHLKALTDPYCVMIRLPPRKENLPMVNKSKSQNSNNKQKKTKIKKLNLTRQTVKDLSDSEAKMVKGGVGLNIRGTSQPQPPSG